MRVAEDLKTKLTCYGHAHAQGDPTYRSLMEESSVDYIQKFKELASSMDKEGT